MKPPKTPVFPPLSKAIFFDSAVPGAKKSWDFGDFGSDLLVEKWQKVSLVGVGLACTGGSPPGKRPFLGYFSGFGVDSVAVDTRLLATI